jgi:hypothetical protein
MLNIFQRVTPQENVSAPYEHALHSGETDSSPGQFAEAQNPLVGQVPDVDL